MSPGELARGGRGWQQPTPAAGWRARRAPHLEKRPFSGGHADCPLVLGGGGMMQAWKGGCGFIPNENRILCLVIFKKKKKTSLRNSWDKIMRLKHCSHGNLITCCTEKTLRLFDFKKLSRKLEGAEARDSVTSC